MNDSISKKEIHWALSAFLFLFFFFFFFFHFLARPKEMENMSHSLRPLPDHDGARHQNRRMKYNKRHAEGRANINYYTDKCLVFEYDNI